MRHRAVKSLMPIQNRKPLPGAKFQKSRVALFMRPTSRC